MNKFKGVATVLAILCSAVGSQSQAGSVTNGDFETGNLSGWFSSGSTAMGTGAAGYFPLAGTTSALVVAVSQAPVPPYSCAVDIWNVNCPQPLAFTASGAALPTHTNYQGVGVGFAFFRGSFIGQDMNVTTAGDRLGWIWSPLGEAAGGISSIDEARFYATNGSIELAINYDQGITSYVFPSAGLWSVYFGLFQTEDPYGYSAVLVDEIGITPVPEPATLWLGLFGLAALGAWLRRPRAL